MLQKTRTALTACVLLALVALIVIQLYDGAKTREKIDELNKPRQAPGQTVVSVGEGQQVPIYASPRVTSPNESVGDTLPRFTRIEQICYRDIESNRWFYARLVNSAGEPTGQEFAVQSNYVLNQTRVDVCRSG